MIVKIFFGVFVLALVACGSSSDEEESSSERSEEVNVTMRSLVGETWLSSCVELEGEHYRYSISFFDGDRLLIQEMPHDDSECNEWDGHGVIYRGIVSYGEDTISSEGMLVTQVDIELDSLGTIKTLTHMIDDKLYLGDSFYQITLDGDRDISVNYINYFAFRAD